MQQVTTEETFRKAVAIIAAAWSPTQHNSPAIVIDVRLTTLFKQEPTCIS